MPPAEMENHHYAHTRAQPKAKLSNQ